jgi:tRNA(Ile)-lysidine synthase
VDGAVVRSFAEAWRRLGAPERALFAVSGGSDSIALLRLAAAALGPRSILAATVDHGLRVASADEALKAAQWCAAVGVSCDVLRWRGAKPYGGVQAAAREARYALLSDYARTHGASAIVTAHTQGDQAETMLMRLKRGGGPRGLAGISSISMIAVGAAAPIVLLRPLLDCGRSDLQTYLRSLGQSWIEDPSNEDVRFERVAARRTLGALRRQGELGASALAGLAATAAGVRRRLNLAEVLSFEEAGGEFHSWGGVSIDARLRLDAASRGLAARMIRAVGGGDHRPDEARAVAAILAAAAGQTASLGGALIGRSGGRLFLWREPAALLGRAGETPAPRIDLAPGARTLWDRRFIVANLTSRPLSLGAFGLRSRPPDVDRPATAAASLPSLTDGDEVVAAPGLANDEAFMSLVPERFDEIVRRIGPADVFVTGAHGARLC